MICNISCWSLGEKIRGSEDEGSENRRTENMQRPKAGAGASFQPFALRGQCSSITSEDSDCLLSAPVNGTGQQGCLSGMKQLVPGF